MTRRLLSATLIAAAAATALPASAQDKVTIGFITDLSGIYLGKDGKDGAMLVQMAIDDFGGKVLGKPIELLVADHQDKADIAAAKAREWYDTKGMAMLLGGTNSGTDMAMSRVALEKKRVFITPGGGASALSNEACNPYTVQYDWDTLGQAKGTGSAVVAQGGKSWFILAADYAFGHSLQADVTRMVTEKGGKIVGAVRHPINTSDFSSFTLQAKASNAQVLALANAGGDFTNSLKSVKDFGLDKQMKVVAMTVFADDINALGLKNTAGLLLTTTWDWSLNEQTRAFGKRFYEKTKKMPTSIQAGDYSATMTYLKAVKAAGTTDAEKVMAQLKSMPIDDFYGKGTIRANGRFVHDAYLMQVKNPDESKSPWDYLKLVSVLKADDIALTKAESQCPLYK